MEPVPQKVCLKEVRQEIKEPVPQKVCLEEVRQEIKEPLSQKVCFQEVRQEINEPVPQKVCLEEVLKPFQKEIRVKEVRKVREGRKKAAMAYRRFRVDCSSVTVSGHFYGDTADWVQGDV